MRSSRWLLTSFAALALLAAAGTAWMQRGPTQPSTNPNAAASGVRGILFAQPFTLEQSYEHTWRLERPAVSAGWICVLDVDPEFVVPRQGYEPVLFVGEETAERINHGDGSGHLVVLVPSTPAPTADGEPSLDLLKASIWFGTPRLPEQVDAQGVADEIAAAKRVGIRPLAAGQVLAAKKQGGALATFVDRTELERYAATLVQRWAPDEDEFARGLLQPLLK